MYPHSHCRTFSTLMVWVRQTAPYVRYIELVISFPSEVNATERVNLTLAIVVNNPNYNKWVFMNAIVCCLGLPCNISKINGEMWL